MPTENPNNPKSQLNDLESSKMPTKNPESQLKNPNNPKAN
jgi:hypothetical protein